MSLQPYVFPSSPSLQVKAVQKYLKYISEGDFDSLTSLVTDDYTLATSPSNMGVPTKTMKEEVVSLKALQSGIDGKPLAVSRAQTWHEASARY
jgi:ketosteroid isomerase-like protein